MEGKMISSVEPEKKYIELNARRMANVEAGSGDPIVFQHGNPTSSDLWLDTMAHFTDQGFGVFTDARLHKKIKK